MDPVGKLVQSVTPISFLSLPFIIKHSLNLRFEKRNALFRNIILIFDGHFFAVKLGFLCCMVTGFVSLSLRKVDCHEHSCAWQRKLLLIEFH